MQVRCLVFSFKGNKQDIVHNDGGMMFVRETLTQTNSHIPMLTDMSLDETPDIHSDYKNILIVNPTEVFLVKGNGVYVSIISNTDTTFVGVSSGMLLLVYRQKGDYTTVFTKLAGRQSRPNVSHTSSMIFSCCFISPSTRNTASCSRSTTPTSTTVRRHAHTLASSD